MCDPPKSSHFFFLSLSLLRWPCDVFGVCSSCRRRERWDTMCEMVRVGTISFYVRIRLFVVFRGVFEVGTLDAVALEVSRFRGANETPLLLFNSFANIASAVPG